MLRIIILSLSFIVFSANSIERLSFYKLITSPEQYIGKKVYLTGYLITLGEHCLLISNGKETAMMYKEYEMVSICSSDFNNEIKQKSISKFNEKYGVVVGSFEIGECRDNIKLGTKLAYLGCLKNVSHLMGPIYENGPRMPPPPVK